MAMIRYLTLEDLNPLTRYRHMPGQVVLKHAGGPKEDYVLVRWHKKVGDQIISPEIIATLETASMVLEIEAFESGVVEELCFKIGEPIPDGAVMAKIIKNEN
jgi:pyruvate dehydrogenase E2 component (dihydrolipoamide acetyltransferase)